MLRARPGRFPTHCFIFAARGNVRALQSTPGAQGNGPAPTANFPLSGRRVSVFPAPAIGHVLRRGSRAERAHATSPCRAPLIRSHNARRERGERDRRASLGNDHLPAPSGFSAHSCRWHIPSLGTGPCPPHPGRAPGCGTAPGFPRDGWAFFWERAKPTGEGSF